MTTTSILESLQRRWLWIAIAWGLCFTFVYLGLRQVWDDTQRWVLLTLPALLYSLWVFWRALPTNHPPDDPDHLRATFGLGNTLSLSRGLALSLLAGFVLPPSVYALGGWLAWVPAILYTLNDVADFTDGLVARLTKHVTKLGGVLDLEFDSLGVLIMTFLLVRYDRVPWWYLFIGLARYLFVFGLWWRRQCNMPLAALSPSVHRKALAGLQMGYMSIALWPIFPSLLTAVCGVTIGTLSLLSFVRDWLVMSQALDPNHPTYYWIRSRVYHWTTQRVPWLVRVLLTLILIYIASVTPNPPLWFAGILLIGGWMLAFGFVGRWGVLLLNLPITYYFNMGGNAFLSGLSVFLITYTIIFGTGPFSLWRPTQSYFQIPTS